MEVRATAMLLSSRAGS